MKIIVSNISKTINKNKVLDNINMEFEGGRIYGIKGVNGSGKTMVMRAICGLIRVDSGYIQINQEILGKDIEFPRSIGVLIEKAGLIEEYSAMKNLKFIADIRKQTSEEEIRHILNKLGLNPDDKRKVKKYSLGMRQKLGIAQSFIDAPDILLLDEPFNALDEKSVDIVKAMIREYINNDRIIILSCHDSGIINELCDKIYDMEEGRLVEK